MCQSARRIHRSYPCDPFGTDENLLEFRIDTQPVGRSPETALTVYRVGIAKLLAESIEVSRKLALQLGKDDARVDVWNNPDVDPRELLRLIGARVIHKAGIHTEAVLRADESSNLHSLAVQMRPVLECAGQAVYLFRNIFIAPGVLVDRQKATALIETRLNADIYQSIRRAMKGTITRDELQATAERARADLATEFCKSTPRRQKNWRLNQEDKVDSLNEGQRWYRYITENFCHSSIGNLKSISVNGGFRSSRDMDDDWIFLSLMSYLTVQIAQMNVAIASAAEDSSDRQLGYWVELAQTQLINVSESSKTLVNSATNMLLKQVRANI